MFKCIWLSKKKKKFDKIKPISGIFISDTQIAEIFKTVIHAPMESLVLENLNYNKTIALGIFFCPFLAHQFYISLKNWLQIVSPEYNVLIFTDILGL